MMYTHHPFKHGLPVPAGFSLIENGTLSVLIKDEYKLRLLQQDIGNPRHLLAGGHTSGGKHLRGRGTLTSIPLEGPGGIRMLGKQCMRGGLVRHLSHDIFWSGNRPFEEMTANRIILERGIMTAEIIAAAQERLFGPFYRGYIFSLEIPCCVDLISYFDGLSGRASGKEEREKAAVLEAVACAISSLHNRGICHGDLHLKNVLIRPGNEGNPPEVYLIDFDKAVIKERLSARERINNFLRFNRSIEKYRFFGGSITAADQLMLHRAYLKGNKDLEDLLCRGLKRSGRLLALRRYAWRLSTPRDKRGKQ